MKILLIKHNSYKFIQQKFLPVIRKRLQTNKQKQCGHLNFCVWVPNKNKLLSRLKHDKLTPF